MKKAKAFITDLFFSASGLIAMNACISFLIYPLIYRQLGTSMQGRVLFFVSLANLIAGSFGSGANYGRMKIFSRYKKSYNGDSNIYLLLLALLSLMVSAAAVIIKKDSAETGWLFIAVLIFATSVRMYGDVEYRLSLNYRRFSLYYLVITVGYLAGILLFFLTKKWILIFLTGELFGILFVILTGQIFKGPLFQRSELFRENLSTDAKVSVSFFMADLVGASDRFLFPVLLHNGDELTSLYYYASLVGKMMSLLSTPLNGVLNGYISRDEGKLKPKTFLKMLLAMLLIFVIVTAVSVGISIIFVRMFYADAYDKVRTLFLIANAGQVIFFVGNTLMVVVLRYTKERNQLIVNGIYILLFFTLAIPLIRKYSIQGMAWGILIVNTVRFLAFSGIGLLSLTKEGNP